MMHHIHFCKTSDGVTIAYASGGNGHPLIKTPTWLNHVELDMRSSVWEPWIRQFTQRFQLTRYDARSCGLSDREVAPPSFATHRLDLEAVVKASGLRRFALFGGSQGGAIAIDYAARNPDRVSHLILYGAYLRGALKRTSSPQDIEQAHLLLKLVQLGWGQENSAFRQVFATQFMPDGTFDQLRAFDEIQRQTASPDAAARLVQSFYEIDVSEQAAQVVCPTLVMHSRDDARIPFDEGRQVASAIKGAEFVPLESRNHILLEQHKAWIAFWDEISEFMRRHQETSTEFKPGGGESTSSPHPKILRSDARVKEDLADLTARELEVLDLIARGMDNDQIAARLAVSAKTVRNHITSVFAKLEIYTRAKAVAVARDAGLGIIPLK
jgi:pimeloyl-ACP methyl ester carboxylesterase/DNA-binding CsgD family transcriptional regulator